jgi:hypothetical protein
MDKHTTDKIKVQAIPKINIPHYAPVHFLQLGDRHAEVLYMEHQPKCGIQKLSKTEYKVLSTGDIKTYRPNKGKQSEFIRRSMRRLEQLIKANFDTVGNADNALFVTLTYGGEIMTDYDQLYTDFDKFIKRLKYAKKGHKLDYIVVAEPCESGRWHLHMLIKSDQPKLYIDNNDEMVPLWGHGFTKTVRLKSDDVGCYYTAYFSNVEAPYMGDDKENPDDFVFGEDDAHAGDGETAKTKRFKKGDRLRFYPKHMKFYRCSRGIKRPEPKMTTYADVPADLGRLVKTLTHSVSLTSAVQYFDDGQHVELMPEKRVLNSIQRQIYKKTQK